MIDHISHLEELVYEHGRAGMDAVISVILNASSKPAMSLKFDGAPSLFFGVTKNGRKFVATKSLLNKKPIFFTSTEEILEHYRNKNLELASKLIGVFNNINAFIGGSHTQIYQGDILYWPENKQSKYFGFEKSFRANVIKYKAYKFPELKDYGIAIHGAYQYNLNKIDENTSETDAFKHIKSGLYLDLERLSPCVDNIDLISTMTWVKIDKNSKSIKKVLSLYQKYDNKFTDEFYTYLMTNMVKLKKLDNTIIRGTVAREESTQFSDEMRLLRHLFVHINRFKQRLIGDVNCRFKPFVNHIDFPNRDIPINHEGLVVDTNFGKVKIVDRSEFSRINFSSNYIRGWDI